MSLVVKDSEDGPGPCVRASHPLSIRECAYDDMERVPGESDAVVLMMSSRLTQFERRRVSSRRQRQSTSIMSIYLVKEVIGSQKPDDILGNRGLKAKTTTMSILAPTGLPDYKQPAYDLYRVMLPAFMVRVLS